MQSEQTRSSSSENLPFSISRLLSKPFENNNKQSPEKDIQSEHDLAAYKLATSIATSTYGGATALYTYPHLYPTAAAAAAAGHVLRVPPQRTPLTWALPPLHHAALAHQAVKDRLAGELVKIQNNNNVYYLITKNVETTKNMSINKRASV